MRADLSVHVEHKCDAAAGAAVVSLIRSDRRVSISVQINLDNNVKKTKG